jgi:trimeric autotransporter adhesin
MQRTTRNRNFESLESRRLLSSAALLATGELRIAGDDNVNDVATVGLNSRGDKVEVVLNGRAVQSFAEAAVKTVAFHGGSGADALSVLETNGAFGINVRFYGGDDADLFNGGRENDWVRGEAGDDTINLGDGKNFAHGGDGSDTTIAGQGKNLVRGGAGKDTLVDTAAASTLSVRQASGDGKNSPVALPKIYVIYNGTNNATVINPYVSKGVTITASGGAVTVAGTSGINNLEYDLLGTSAAGSLTMSSTTPATFVLNNLNLTNANGPAINITGGQNDTFLLYAGTANALTDGAGNSKNGTLQTDGKITLGGTGALTLNGVKKHGISTTSSIEVQSSAITVASAASDGFHSEGFTLSGGTVTIAASGGDAIDAGDAAVAINNGTLNATSTAADVKALKTGNNTITVTGGALNLNVSGNASKAISAKGAIAVSAGTFGITLSGAAILTASGSGFDPSYAAAIKSDAAINISGGNFTITATSTATGAKGFSAGQDITITDGTFNTSTAAAGASYVNTLGVTDSYSTSSFTSDANINIGGGTFTVTNTGKDGKGFSADNSIFVTGGTIGVTNSGAAGRGFNADGNISFAGGNSTVNLSGATVLTPTGAGTRVDPSYPSGAKADGSITVSAGSVTITGIAAATGARGLSADAAINVTGGAVSVNVAGNGANYTNAAGVADSYAAAAFSSDTAISITGGSVTTTSSGTGGKGLKSDGTITIGSVAGVPTVNLTTTGARFLTTGTDYNHPKTMVATGAIQIINGNNTLASTDDGIHSDASITISGGTNKVTATSATQGVGEGVEAPIINFTGGVTNVQASNDGINATYGLVNGGDNNPDGSQLNISGGILIAAGSDAIDSNGNVTITGGTTVLCGPTAAPEEGLDFNGQFYMNGGFLISAGSNTNMTRGADNASTQVNMFLKSTAQLPATSLLHIRNAAGTEMVTFKPKNNVYWYHFSSGALAQGTQYQVYFGGTYTGGSFVGGSTGWGLYTGGTYALVGATLKSTFTTSGTTKVNTVSF